MQLALTLKAYSNENKVDTRIIVPINLVDTFELGEHNGYLMNLMSLYMMKNSGIEVVKEIIY